MSIVLRNPFNGKIREAKRGFSFTVLFFGPIVPLVRGDYKGMFIMWLTILLGYVLFLIPGVIALFVWSAKYNNWHLNKLIADGFEIQEENL